jgi:hypothetical protein
LIFADETRSPASISRLSSVDGFSGKRQKPHSTFQGGTQGWGHLNKHNLATFQKDSDPNRRSWQKAPATSTNQNQNQNHNLHSTSHLNHPNQRLVDVPYFPSYLSKVDELDSSDVHRTLRLNSLGSFDDNLSESVAETRDDDDTTTTSGSYTINADELCNEIDDLFFRPDTIV